MKTLALELTAANITALDVDLRASLAGHFYGLTFDGKQVTLLLDDAVTNNDIKQAKNIVATATLFLSRKWATAATMLG